MQDYDLYDPVRSSRKKILTLKRGKASKLLDRLTSKIAKRAKKKLTQIYSSKYK